MEEITEKIKEILKQTKLGAYVGSNQNNFLLNGRLVLSVEEAAEQIHNILLENRKKKKEGNV